MIYLIIKSYLTILLSVGLGALSIFIVGLYWIFKPRRNSRLKNSSEFITKPLNDKADISLLDQTTDSGDSVADTNNDMVIDTDVEFSSQPIDADDVNAIAGDDKIMTQLDLARAYIETGSKNLAKKILEEIIIQGNFAQQEEARNLLGRI